MATWRVAALTWASISDRWVGGRPFLLPSWLLVQMLRFPGRRVDMTSLPPGAAANGDSDQVLVEANGSTRTLILNRPRQLNALSSAMIMGLLRCFTAYEEENGVKLLIVKGKGRAFCAGGDVAAVVQSINNDSWKYGADFFRNEFLLNYIIATYNKPQVTLLSDTSKAYILEIQIREGRLQTVGECLRREYRMVCHVMRGDFSRDFFEGCRAILLVKDRNPKWTPPSLEQVHDHFTYPPPVAIRIVEERGRCIADSPTSLGDVRGGQWLLARARAVTGGAADLAPRGPDGSFQKGVQPRANVNRMVRVGTGGAERPRVARQERPRVIPETSAPDLDLLPAPAKSTPLLHTNCV